MKCFKKFLNEEMASGHMKGDPFVGMKYKQEETNPTFLTKEELNTIANAGLHMTRLEIVRDMFLFSCYTGLAFIDASKLKYSVKDNNGRL